jgi:3-hydroxybutyryl-CoA dehydrogenase
MQEELEDFTNQITVGVEGVGFLGRGIVACLLSQGFKVIAHVRSEKSRLAAENYIHHALNELESRGLIKADVKKHWPERITFVGTLLGLAHVDFVIESVVEDIEVKNEVYDRLEEIVRKQVPIATNTSSLPVTLLASNRRNPERFLGMHWAEPAYATRFLELIRGEQTSDSAFELARKLSLHAGKDPSIVQKDVPAFVVNRICYAMYRESLHLLETGVADVETIDRSFRNAVGLWAAFAGPFRWMDLTGGPALYGKTMSNVFPTLDCSSTVSPLIEKLMQEDARGTANMHGFYDYTPEKVEAWEQRFRQSVWQIYEWTKPLLEQQA